VSARRRINLHARSRRAARLLAATLLAFCGCGPAQTPAGRARVTAGAAQRQPPPTAPSPVSYESPLLGQLVAAAVARASQRVTYDGGYYAIPYPNGDVPPDRGACTDEVIRSYRAAGVDLQREVHEDMKADFVPYPRRFGRARPDTNIDHRRVPNLMTFFARRGRSLPATDDAADYAPGDIVTWELGGGLTHIGVLTDQPAATPGRYLILHNIGAGPRLEDVLFAWKITGHYRYAGPPPASPTPAPARRARR
jgi:uncharacterized protein YijF (DUF1287 family)